MIYIRTVRPLLELHDIISGGEAGGAVLPDWSSKSSRQRAPHQEGAQAPPPRAPPGSQGPQLAASASR